MSKTAIATCNYCGARAALVLSGTTSHELACSSCGAPLHNLKKLKSGQVDAAAHRPPRKGRKGARIDGHSTPLAQFEAALRKPKKRKHQKKSTGRKLFGEAFDLLGDIFD